MTPDERKQTRHSRKASEAQAVREYNRAGIDACCDALGAGDADDWPQDEREQGE